MTTAELLKQVSQHIPFIGLVMKNAPAGRDRIVESLLIVILTSSATVKFQEKPDAAIPVDIVQIKNSVRQLEKEIADHRIECNARVAELAKERKAENGK